MILDVKIPKLDGLTIAKEMRASGSAVPVLMLTASGTTEEKIIGLESGADAYLTKPFVFAELFARVKALIRRGKRARGAEICFADLRLNPVSRKVWRGGKEIELTGKEYALLEYFARNPNTILTRLMISENIWGTVDKFSNIVEVYINYLRRKVDKPYATRLIHSVRGQGYCMREE